MIKSTLLDKVCKELLSKKELSFELTELINGKFPIKKLLNDTVFALRFDLPNEAILSCETLADLLEVTYEEMNFFEIRGLGMSEEEITEECLIDRTVKAVADFLCECYQPVERYSSSEINFLFDLLSRDMEGNIYGHELISDNPKVRLDKRDIENLLQDLYKEMISNINPNIDSNLAIKHSRRFTELNDFLQGKRKTFEITLF